MLQLAAACNKRFKTINLPLLEMPTKTTKGLSNITITETLKKHGMENIKEYFP
jgi:hypothetical protein